MTKECADCARTLPTSAFYFSKSKQKFFSYCRECSNARSMARYRANRESYLAEFKKYREANKEKRREADREYYQANRGRVLERTAEYRDKNREAIREYFREYDATPERREAKNAQARAYRERPDVRAKRKRWLYKLRLIVFAQYGGAICVCCGETEPALLTLDHKNDDGAEHRREVGQRNIYLWAKQHDFPPIFIVTCFNCNIGRYQSGFGMCPHELARQELLLGSARPDQAA